MSPQIKTEQLTLFFFFVTLHEAFSLKLTHRLLNRIARLPLVDESQVWTEAIQTLELHLKDRSKVPAAAVSFQELVFVPPGLDLSSWREFKKKVDREVLVTTTMRLILGIAPSVIAKATLVTEGTVFHRTSLGLRLLGTMTPLAGLGPLTGGGGGQTLFQNSTEIDGGSGG